MVVVLEGVSCSGKTTLINALLKQFPNSIGIDPKFGTDHHDGHKAQILKVSDDLHVLQNRLRNYEPKTLEDELTYQKAYIPLVRARLGMIAVAAKQNRMVFAHRDILSNYVQGYIRFRDELTPDRIMYANIFEDLCVKMNPYEFPDLHIISKIPWEIFIERSSKRKRNTWKALLDRDYFSALTQSYDSVASVLGERCLNIDGTKSVEENLHITTAWILNHSKILRKSSEKISILKKLTDNLTKEP